MHQQQRCASNTDFTYDSIKTICIFIAQARYRKHLAADT